MAITAVALQDHISRSLLHSLSLSDPVRDSLRVRGSSQRPCQKNKHPQHSSSQRSLEGREYVLDPAPPPLTLGTLDQPCCLFNYKHPCSKNDRSRCSCPSYCMIHLQLLHILYIPTVRVFLTLLKQLSNGL